MEYDGDLLVFVYFDFQEEKQLSATIVTLLVDPRFPRWRSIEAFRRGAPPRLDPVEQLIDFCFVLAGPRSSKDKGQLLV